jgi:hypothetical protein
MDVGLLNGSQGVEPATQLQLVPWSRKRTYIYTLIAQGELYLSLVIPRQMLGQYLDVMLQPLSDS